MRHLLHTLLAIMLIAIAMGCSRNAHDKRLVLADTLMWTAPDSALHILQAINRHSSLHDEENLAYHALLLTQARFRVDYYDYPSDSLINTALNHYSDNHNRELYTRALLYKGAYYEVHDNPVEAIKWYKRAEDNADTTDYRNLAQINMRMGMLYYDNYASNNLDLEKFRESYMYYKKLGDKPMMLFSIHHIGNLYRDTNKKRAISLLTQASNLAKELNDTVSYYVVLSDLSLAFLLDSCFEEAKATALKCYEMDGKYATNLAHCDAANAYAELNMADSARYYINKVNIDNCSQFESMLYAYTLSRVFKAEGNLSGALKQENLSDEITQKIVEASERNIIHETENIEDSRILRDKNSTLSSVEWKAMLVSLLALLLLVILGFYVWRFKRYRQLVDELKQEQQITKSLVEELKTVSATDKQVKDTTAEDRRKNENNDRIGILNHYLNLYYETINDLLQKSNKMSREAFVREFKKTLVDTAKDNYYWEVTRMLADERSGGLVTYLCDNNKNLIEAEIRIICLTCQGYKNNTISTITGYSANSIKSIKTRIKNKIGITYSLDAYIKQELLKTKHKVHIEKDCNSI